MTSERDRWKRFGTLWLTAFTITALPVFVDQTVHWWKGWLKAFVLWTIVSVFIAGFWLWSLNWFRQRHTDLTRVSETDTEYHTPGGVVVMTFGLGNSAQREIGKRSLTDQIVEYAKPSVVVLVVTDASEPEARQLKASGSIGGRLTTIHLLRHLAGVIEPERIINGLRGLDLLNNPEGLLFDFTGGTKALGVSAYLAASELNADACALNQTTGNYELFPRSTGDDASAV